jgi:peptide/nickel transport system permease protein
VVRKAARLVPVLLLVSFATFSMVRLLPGDPARSFLGPEAPQDQVDLLRKEMKLDKPITTAYVQWMGKAVTGDLGQSFRTNISVVDTLKQRLPVSVELMVLAQLFALLFAIPIGVYTAYRAGGLFDRIWSAVAFGFVAVPGFILGLFLIYLIPVRFGWLQISGFTPLGDSITGNLQSLVLPSLTLGFVIVAVYSRLLRSDMIATLQEDYVAMAKAKGMPTRRILFTHALRPSSFSLVTLAGLNIGQLISGAVLVEFLFSLPGIGLLMMDSILSKDLFVLQGTVLFIVVSYVVINVLVDLLYAMLDPRIRVSAAPA